MSKFRNTRVIFILMFTLLLCGIVNNAYAENELDERYVLAIRDSMKAEGESEYFITQIKMMDKEGGFSWFSEFLYVITWDDDHSKVFIYAAEDLNVTQVWESIEIPGQAIDAWSYDLNDDWICEHQLITVKEDQNGTQWYQVWVFSWEGANSKLIYPENTEINALTSMERYGNLDYDKDWTYEFIVLEKKDNEHMFYKYYAFNKNNLHELMIEKEAIVPVKKSQPQTQVNTAPFDEQYPEIVKYVHSNHAPIKIYGIYPLWYTFRYMVLTDKGKIIVEQQLDEVTEWAILDSNFDKYVFDPNKTMALDMDNDSMPEIPLYSFDDINNRKIYHYFVSVQSGAYKLLSPLDENGRSRIWTMDGLLQYDRAKDGNVVVIGFKKFDRWL